MKFIKIARDKLSVSTIIQKFSIKYLLKNPVVNEFLL